MKEFMMEIANNYAVYYAGMGVGLLGGIAMALEFVDVIEPFITKIKKKFSKR